MDHTCPRPGRKSAQNLAPKFHIFQPKKPQNPKNQQTKKHRQSLRPKPNPKFIRNPKIPIIRPPQNHTQSLINSPRSNHGQKKKKKKKNKSKSSRENSKVDFGFSKPKNETTYFFSDRIWLLSGSGSSMLFQTWHCC